MPFAVDTAPVSPGAHRALPTDIPMPAPPLTWGDVSYPRIPQPLRLTTTKNSYPFKSEKRKTQPVSHQIVTLSKKIYRWIGGAR